jgi:hypothetical protein
MHLGYFATNNASVSPQVLTFHALLRLLPPKDQYTSCFRNAVRSRAWFAKVDGCSYEVCGAAVAALLILIVPGALLLLSFKCARMLQSARGASVAPPCKCTPAAQFRLQSADTAAFITRELLCNYALFPVTCVTRSALRTPFISRCGVPVMQKLQQRHWCVCAAHACLPFCLNFYSWWFGPYNTKRRKAAS